MTHSWMILVMLGAGAGCGSRAAVVLDSSTAGDSVARDSRVQPDIRSPAVDALISPRCTSLAMVAQTTLELADTMKLGPAVASDGARFALVWHSQPAVISSMNGDLRFALVDGAGKTDTPDGISLGSDDGRMHAAIGAPPAHPGQYAVLNLPVPSNAPVPSNDCVNYSRIDAKGKVQGGLCVKGQFYQGALSNHPAGGETLFLAVQSGSPELMVVDTAGSLPAPKILGSQQVMSSMWVAPGFGGLAAAWSTTGSNATLFLVDDSFTVKSQTGVGHGLSIKYPSFAVIGGGLAAVYTAPGGLGGVVEYERFDAAGQPAAHSPVAQLGDYADTTGETALSWTGAQLAVTYSSPVSGQYSVRLVETGGQAGDAVQVPRCLATGHSVVTAWGPGGLAVVTIDEASGVMKSSACVTLMGCR